MAIQPGEPVYFLSLELQNVGAFGPEGVRIDLSDGQGHPAKWTLILGENGIGKTTALECLLAITPLPNASAFEEGPPIYARLWALNGNYQRLLRRGGASYLKISADVVPASFHIGEVTLTGFLNARAEDKEPVRYQIGGDPAKSLWFDEEAESLTERSDQWPGKLVYSYPVARETDFANARFPESAPLETSNEAGDTLRSHSPILVDGWLISLHHTLLALANSKVLWDHNWLIDLLVDALPGVHEIRATPPKDVRDTVRMEYLTDDGWVPYSNLGLGYKSVMGLIGDLAYRLYTAYPDSPEPLKEAAVVLIDEIDLHLHAKWQRDLIRVLSERFPNVQFIATAHSPLMVQAAAGHNLVLLYRDPETKQVRVDNDVDAIANWRLDQIVTSELFGVPTARPPKYDKEVERRDAILAKLELTDEDRAEVRRIEAELGDVPLLASPEGRRTEDLLRQTLAALTGKPEE